jgi:hypothetical protein
MWICWIEIPPTRTKYWTVLPTRYRKMNSNRKSSCTPTRTATSANWLSFSIKMHYRTKGRASSSRTNFSSVVLTSMCLSANKKIESRTSTNKSSDSKAKVEIITIYWRKLNVLHHRLRSRKGSQSSA